MLFSIDLPQLASMPDAPNDPADVITVEITRELTTEPGHDVALDTQTNSDTSNDAPTSDSSSSSPSVGAAAESSGADSLVPYGATYQDNSEFMIGDIWVTVVLLESTNPVAPGTSTPVASSLQENWSTSRINTVKNEITAGLTWWEDTFAKENSRHNLDFHIDFTYADNPLEVSYEPITLSQSQEGLWIDQFLNEVDHNTSASYITDLDRWNHDQRVAHGTDWAFTIFVADSLVDGDGKFAANSNGSKYFAYAYIGGPFMTMTYDNNGWGISRMDNVTAHEVAHIFYALDEYPNGNSYTDRSGYYNTQNLNGAKNHPNPDSRVDSLMAESSRQVRAYAGNFSSPSSLEMVGWKDSDGDGIFDVLDVQLSLTGSGSFNNNTGIYSFSGSSSVNTLNNLNPRGFGRDITINTVDRIQYRLDGGEWIDGNTYGQHSASVSQNVSVLTAGNHTIEFRTIVEQTGQTSATWSDSFNVKNDQPAIIVTPTSGLETSEAGGSDSFTVKLNTKPTANVTIGISSSDTSEGTASTTALTFTPDNWGTAQTVTVTGQDDSADDGNQAYTIITAAASSADTSYNGLNPADVTVTNNDDDGPPPVVVDFNDYTIQSYDPAQDLNGTATVEDSGSTLALTGNTWKKIELPYTITADTVLEFDFQSDSQGEIHGIGFDNNNSISNDHTFKLYGTQGWGITAYENYAGSAPGSKHYVISVGQHYTGDVLYLVFANDHDEAATPTAESRFSNIVIREGQGAPPPPEPAGITVTPTSGLATTEAGGSDSFTVKLNTKPTANVTIGISSSDTSEGTASTTALTFTPNNWDTAQTVTVTGQDDSADDGNQAYTIITAAASSADTSYNGLNPDDVTVTNSDNDDGEPSSSISVNFNDYTIQSYDPAQDLNGTATVEDSGSTLALTGNTWKKIELPYTITANTVLEFDFQSDSQGEIHGIGFDNNDQFDADHTFKLYGTQGWGITAYENYAGSAPGSKHYVISVGQHYTGDVQSLFFVNDHDEAATPTAESRFSNIVIREGQGAQLPAAIVVTPTSGLATTEAGGSDSFTVKLNTKPTANVTIGISSSDTSEGTASTTALTFTPNNWDTAQTVTVTGQDDSADDGNQAYTIITAAASSADTSYNGLNPDDVTVTNSDNDDAIATNSVDFDQATIRSYGGRGQDQENTVVVKNGGATLDLTGNAWKRINLSYTITANTVLEFDFQSDSQGEIHAIGFDNNNSISSDQAFKLYGTEGWGISDYNNYASSASAVQHYVIPVGQYLTGSMEYLFFVNDHDVSNPTAHSQFSNIVIREAVASTNDSGSSQPADVEGHPKKDRTPNRPDTPRRGDQGVSVAAAAYQQQSDRDQLAGSRRVRRTSGVRATDLRPIDLVPSHIRSAKPKWALESDTDDDADQPWRVLNQGFRLSSDR